MDDYDPDDPVEILRILPREHHAQFRAEYEAAAQGARQVEGYRKLHTLLRLWRLRALAYSDPGYQSGRDAAARAARDGGSETAISLDDLVTDWDDRLRDRRQ